MLYLKGKGYKSPIFCRARAIVIKTKSFPYDCIQFQYTDKNKASRYSSVCEITYADACDPTFPQPKKNT